VFVKELFLRVRHCPCMVEVRFGVAQFISLLPLLYYLGDWVGAQNALSRDVLPVLLTTLYVNLLHNLDQGLAADSPANPSVHTELATCHVEVESLFGPVRPIQREVPQNFAMVALLETLARWQRRGVPVSVARLPSQPPPGQARTMSAHAWRKYTESASSAVKEYLPQLRRLCELTPNFAYALPLAEAVAEGRRPGLPGEEELPLLRFSLAECCACSLPSCGRTS